MYDLKTVAFDASQWQLVPKTPNSTMMCAGEATKGPRPCWDAMLAAAPTPAEQANTRATDLAQAIREEIEMRAEGCDVSATLAQIDMLASMAAAQSAMPTINEGETYLCGFVDANGDVEHVVIVAINNEEATWQSQMEWAKELGADLMTRPEQAIAFAKMPECFEKRAYWSNEDAGDGFAWYQGFLTGRQYYYGQYDELRAVAVRRVRVKGGCNER